METPKVTWNNTQPGDVARLIKQTLGKGGAQAETCISVSPLEIQEGTVRVATVKGSEAAKLLKKAGSKLLRWQHEGAVGGGSEMLTEMDFDASAFRGIEYLFDPHPERNDEMPSDIAVLLEYLSGRHGADREAGVNYTTSSLGEGFVRLWATHGAWAAETLRRMWPHLTDYGLEEIPNTDEFCVHLTFRSDRFGGVARAFRKLDGERRTMSEEEKAKLRGR